MSNQYSQYAGGTFKEVIEFLVVKLLKPDKELVEKEIQDLIDLNNLKVGVKHTGFTYGKYYIEFGGRVVENLGWSPQLDPSLHHKAEGLAERAIQIRKDFEYIQEVFAMMVNGSRNWQDFRDSLPDCVIQFHPDLYKRPRSISVDHYLRTNKPLKFKYEMLLPRLHTYSMMSLLT